MRALLLGLVLAGCSASRVGTSTTANPPASVVAFDRKVSWNGHVFSRLELRFEGNESAPADALARDLDVVHGLVERDYLARDALVIAAWYYDHGYADVHVDPPDVRAAGDTVIVTFRIREGGVYTIAALDCYEDLGSGKRAVPLGWKTTLGPGARFARRELLDSTRAMEVTYRDLGFAYVDARTATELDKASHRISIVIPVLRGPFTRFQALVFVGNKTIPEATLRKEVLVTEGDPYHETKLMNSRQRLLDTGWFLRVDVWTKKAQKEDEVVVTFELDERPQSIGAPTAMR